MALFGSKKSATDQAPAAAMPPAAPAQPAPIELTPEQKKKLEEASDQRAATFGRILALMSVSQRHNKLSLREINALLTPSIALGQFALMSGAVKEGQPATLVAVVWWALVSPEVDKRLTESRSEYLHVEASEWKSGDQPWIIEAVGDQKMISELLKKLAERNFKDKPAKLRALMPDGRIAVGRLEAKPKES